ncbi:MAG: hypothetical protein EBR88_00330 [Betaproteobacteria bacterium]|nr:hypothetical protein [Betaproteobacteria bacterium]
MSEEMLTESDPSVSETPDVSSEPQAESAGSTQESSVAQPQEAPQRVVWDAFRTLPQFEGQDDVAIARSLYAAMEREKAASEALAQYQQYMPVAQEYLRNRPEFEAWRASRQQPAAQPQQGAKQEQGLKKWWNPPELRDSYRQYLVKDENGREVIAPDAPLDAKHALYEYQKYKADFAQKFLTDPEQALGPMVQEQAAQIAQQIVQQQFREFSERNYVSSLERENADWLFGADNQPTPEGQAAREYIDNAAAIGIQSPEARWEYATMRVELDLARRLLDAQRMEQQRGQFEQQLMPPQPPENAPNRAQADIDFLRREATRNPSRSASYVERAQDSQPLTFEQRLARSMGRSNN